MAMQIFRSLLTALHSLLLLRRIARWALLYDTSCTITVVNTSQQFLW